MSGSGRDIDPASEMAARIGNLIIDDHYQSPPQPNAHAHSPANNTHIYPNVQTPTRGLNQLQAYPSYPDQQGYPYYPPASGGIAVDGYSAGVAAPASATYAYPAATPDLISLAPPSAAGYEGFSASVDYYAAQQDNRQAAAQHVNSPLMQPNGRGGRQDQRAPRGQNAFQQQQQQQQTAAGLQQQQQTGALTAGYYGYQDSRPYWMNAYQGLYVQQGNERKKGFQGGSYHGQNNQSGLAHRTGQSQGNVNQNNSRLLYSPAPTQASLNLATGASDPYTGGQHSSLGHFQLAQAGFGALNPYAAQGYQGGSSYLFRSRRLDDPGVVRSALLEDFRLNKAKKWDLKDIFGHVVEFSGDQQGSRLIQQKLETSNPEDRQKLFDEIMPNAYQLMTDVFGNYVTQKMFEHGDQLQKAALAKKMEGHVLQLSMQTYGCRVVQKALEHVLVDQRATLVNELKAHILECVKSSNANHVIQRLITLDPPKDVPNAFIGHVEELSKHPYGCRVLQKMFENLSEDLKRPLLDEMHDCTMALMEDQFGNYVVQSVITVGAAEDRDKVIAEMKGNVTRLARHKFASNVVEKAIINASEQDQKWLIDELIGRKPDGSNQVGMLLRDAFGNFPLQTALIAANSAQRQELLDIVTDVFPQIRHTPVGKRLDIRLSQFEADGVLATPRKLIASSTNSTNSDSTATATAAGSEGDEFLMSRTASSETAPVSPEPEFGKLGKISRADSTTPKTPTSAGKANDLARLNKATTVKRENDGDTLEKLLQ